MSCHFDLDRVNGILRCRLDGPLTKPVLLTFNKEITKHAFATNPRAGILDLTNVTALELNSDAVSELASLPPAFPHAERPRYIVAPSAHLFGMSRMFQALGEQTRPNLHVVRSLQEVYEALGVKDPQFEPLTPGVE